MPTSAARSASLGMSVQQLHRQRFQLAADIGHARNIPRVSRLISGTTNLASGCDSKISAAVFSSSSVCISELERPAARQQREDRPGELELQQLARLAPGGRVARHPAASGWPTKVTLMPASVVERRLERKQRQQTIGRARDGADALAPPRPDRRADIVHRAHAVALEASPRDRG